MNLCKNCKKEIKINEDTYRGMCKKCYTEYLYQKIEHIGDKNYQNLFPPEESIIKKFFKKIYTKYFKK